MTRDPNEVRSLPRGYLVGVRVREMKRERGTVPLTHSLLRGRVEDDERAEVSGGDNYHGPEEREGDREVERNEMKREGWPGREKGGRIVTMVQWRKRVIEREREFLREKERLREKVSDIEG